MVRIRSIVGENVVRLDTVAIDLPKTGLVLIVGENNEGKSSIIECVCAGLWSKTLRGTPWFRPGEMSKIAIGIGDTEVVERERKGETRKLRIQGFAGEHDTQAKAQKLLDRMLPSFETWRKTCVFSSSSTGRHFAGSSDAKRKELIESVLQLSQFGPALDACRVDLKRYSDAISIHQNAYNLAQTKMEAEDRRKLEGAEQLRSYKLSDAPDASRADELAEKLGVYSVELDQAKKDERAIGLRSQAQFSDVRVAKQQYSLLRGGKCPTCEQPILPGRVEALQHALECANEALEAANATIEAERAQAQELLEELQASFNLYDSERRSLVRQQDVSEQQHTARDKLQHNVVQASLASTRFLVERTEHSAALGKAKREAAILSTVEFVLGLRGLRAQVIGHTLAGLAAVTNGWLARFGTPIRIELSTKSALKGGGEVDEVGLVIHGAGAGDEYGYEACSTGQQRRIDVAMVLGLAALATAASGETNSTLFFDECLDGLDTKGTFGVCEALEELSQTRCVVVISHNEDLIRKLPASNIFVAENGHLVEM